MTSSTASHSSSGGGNVQVISAPDGWPLWTSDVRSGREHDMTCARTRGVIEVREHLIGLVDLGYEGAADIVRVPVKKTKGKKLTDDHKTYNKLIRGTVASVNASTPCLSCVSRRCAASVSIPTGSGRSPLPPSYCSITRTTAPSEDHTKRPKVTEKGSLCSIARIDPLCRVELAEADGGAHQS
jgi:hypothetical protein